MGKVHGIAMPYDFMPFPQYCGGGLEAKGGGQQDGQSADPSFAAMRSHQFKVHNITNSIRKFVEGGTCPVCPKMFHSRTRLLHHLTMRAKRCNEYILSNFTLWRRLMSANWMIKILLSKSSLGVKDTIVVNLSSLLFRHMALNFKVHS